MHSLWSSVLSLMKIVAYICHLSQPQWIIPMVNILIISLHYLCFVGQKAHDKCHVNQSLFIIWGCIWTRMENSSSESQNLLVFRIVNYSMHLVCSGGSISNVLFLTSFIGWLFQRYLIYCGERVAQDLASSDERWKPSWEIPCVAVLRKDTAEDYRILSEFSCCPHLLWLVS